jgi:hypothetical protein
MPGVEEAAAMGTCGVIGCGGTVSKRIISLEGVSHDDLEGSALKTARIGLEHALDERVEMIRVGWLGEG